MLNRGVTLLEILVVLLIVGVLVGLALPGYRAHLVRVHRAEAAATLQEIASAEERLYLRQGRYVSDLYAAPPAGLGLAVPLSRRYRFSVAVAADGQTYIATATPTAVGGQDTDEDCRSLSLDQRGRRAVSGSRDAGSCWQ